MNIDFEKIRKEEWPVLETMTFLDAACVSFAPQRTVKAVKAFADMTAVQEEANSSAHHIAMDSLRHKAYDEAAKLLNADPEEIALVESTSHGLNIAAQGIELQDGDNIITTNLEFIQVALPWCVMRKDKNIDIRVCKTEDNRFTAKDFAALVDDKTKLIVMSTLEWCNGWQTDLKELGDYCKEKGVYLVVDAVQQLGVTKIDTKACHIDILTAGGHKWLNSPYGTGVLYVKDVYKRQLLYQYLQIFIGSRYNSYIHINHTVSTDSQNFFLLYDSQQLELKSCTHSFNLIKKKSTFVGELKVSHFPALFCTGKCSFFISE